jgi:hypothetical protein
MFEEFVHIRWGISKAADTYGYNRVTLNPERSPGKFSQCGGGYDMVGAALGEYLTKVFGGRLDALADQVRKGAPRLYGMTVTDSGWYLDGACGEDCMVRIAKEIGVEITTVRPRYVDRRSSRQPIGFNVRAD